MALKVVTLAVFFGSVLCAQYGTPVTVPFVGCEIVGPMGSAQPPGGSTMDVAINPAFADQLAFYQAEEGQGVLAPRGWQCAGMYGRGTILLVVMPKIDRAAAAAGKLQIAGPAVAIESVDGSGMSPGQLAVAALCARLFPVRQDWARETLRAAGVQPPSGPYPHDVLNYENDVSVQFRTPANQEGFGTGMFGPGTDPIDGAAMLMGQDSMLVQTRLPDAQRKLTSSILKQVQQDVASKQW